MKEIDTEIIIEASAQKVWQILTDFENYPKWNPFINMIEGKVHEGNSFKVIIQAPESKPMTFNPVCLSFKENQEFVWKGRLFLPGIFDGKHIFKLEEFQSGRTKFIQREEFSGILIGFLWKKLDTHTRKGFEMMNMKLKQEAEK